MSTNSSHVDPPYPPMLFSMLSTQPAACLSATIDRSPSCSTRHDVSSTSAWVHIEATISGGWVSILQKGGTICFGAELDDQNNIPQDAILHKVSMSAPSRPVVDWHIKFDALVRNVLVSSQDLGYPRLKDGMIWENCVAIGEIFDKPTKYVYMTICTLEDESKPLLVLRTAITA